MQSNCFEVQWRSQDLEVGGHHRRKLPPNSGGAHGPFLPLPFPLIPSPLLPSPPSLSLSLEVGPPNPARGSRAEPQPKSNLVHFSLKIRHLVATILMIFVRVN